MTQLTTSRSIQVEESVLGSAIVSGDGNTIYVIQQTQEQPKKAPAASNIGANPYKGLAAFTEQDAAHYFGRETQIERLWQHFQYLFEQTTVPRFLPILGPSGCGKSSLARAGLIPALAQRPLADKQQMRVAVLVPGTRPLESLAGVLARAATNDPIPVQKTDEFEQMLKKGSERNSYEGLRRIVSLIPGIRETSLIILVDQFEEVFSLCQDPDQRRIFINTLLHAASDPTGEVSVVITLRSDFLAETQRSESLNQVIGSDQSVIVPAMNQAELRRAIAAPAEQAGNPLDEATIDLLVKDTEGREGALPLLQFALTRIWEGLIAGKTPAVTYREMGGVGGALAGKAQAMYEQLDQSEQEIARRVFLGLVQLGEGSRDTRRRTRVESLIAHRDTPDAVQQVIHQFSGAGARLISLSSADGRDIAEVTHEALFEHWQQLHEWVENSRDDIRFQRRLGASVDYWEEQGRPEGLLWRSPDLDLLNGFQQRAAEDMTESETEFWRASCRAKQRRRLTRRLATGGLALGFGLTSLSTGFALWNMREAERNNVENLVRSAAQSTDSGDNFTALLTTLAAHKKFQQNRFSDPVILGQIKEQLLTALMPNIYEANRLEAHEQAVEAVRFSPDGQTIATASRDNTARLWQLDGTPLAPMKGHQDQVLNVRFSPDGNSLVTASRDNTARLWRLDGTHIATLTGHELPVMKALFSPDGDLIATASDDNTARLWQPDGTLVETLEGHTDKVTDVAFSPDGSILATTSQDGTAKLWQRDGTILITLERHSAGIAGAKFSPDGNMLATVSNDKTVKLWQRDGTFITTLEGHSAEVTDMQFSADGSIIVTTSNDNTVRLWQRDGVLITTLRDHEDTVWDVQLSPDGETIATSSFDGTVRLWQLDGTAIATLRSHEQPVVHIQFSPDGKTLATASRDGTARLWRLDGADLVFLEAHTADVVDVEFNPERNIIATASADGTAKLWRTDGTAIATLEGHEDIVWQAQFSPAGDLVATASADGTAKLWQLDGTNIETFEGHAVGVEDLQFHPDGELIATAGTDGTVRLWQLDGTHIETFTGHNDVVGNIRFSPDGTAIATSSFDGTAKFWQLDGTMIETVENLERDHVVDIRFSQAGDIIATANGDNMARLWQPDGTPIATLEGHEDILWKVRFDPNDSVILTSSFDGTARLWQRDGTLITTLKGHEGRIFDARFSPDGQMIATVSQDKTLKLWQPDGTNLATFEGHTDNIEVFTFSPDGSTMVTASNDGTVRLWPWDLDLLLTYSCQRVGNYLFYGTDLEPGDRQLCD
ncbi:MAG: hypothetical protein AAF609_12440 [Cyanobacteria bacterium P01_C01_bin.120]